MKYLPFGGEGSLLRRFSFFFFLSLVAVTELGSISPLEVATAEAVVVVFWMCSLSDFSKGCEGATKLGLALIKVASDACS